jgi:DNA polymerase III delta prime subunit
MEKVLHHVAKRAGFDLPDQACEKIVNDSGGNMRKAILVLEALKMQSYAPLLNSRLHFTELIFAPCTGLT